MKNKNTLIFTISIVSLIVISFISLIFGSKILNITDIFDVIFNYSTSKYSFIIFEYRSERQYNRCCIVVGGSFAKVSAD